VIQPGIRHVPIRWRDLDGFNHVNNAVYLSYLEEGRDAWLANALGEGITELTAFVVRHVSIDYVSALTQEDGEAIVRVEVESVGNSSSRCARRLPQPLTAASPRVRVAYSCTQTKHAMPHSPCRPTCAPHSKPRFRDGGGCHNCGEGRTPQPRGCDVRPLKPSVERGRMWGADIQTPRLWGPPFPAVVASAPITKSNPAA